MMEVKVWPLEGVVKNDVINKKLNYGFLQELLNSLARFLFQK